MKQGQTEKKEGKLERRMTRMILAVVMAAFALTFIIALFSTYRLYRLQEINKQRAQLDQAAARILTLQTTTENLGKQVIYDNVILDFLDMEFSSTGEYLYAQRDAQRELASYSFILDGINEIMIYTNDGRTVSSKDVKQPFQPEDNAWYQEFLDSGKTSMFSDIHQSEPGRDGRSIPVISYITSYYSVGNTSVELGKLVINIELSQIEEILSLDSSMLRAISLYDSFGRTMIASGESTLSYEKILDNEEAGQISAGNGNVLLISSDMDDGWKLTVEISGQSLFMMTLRSCLWLLFSFALITVALLAALRLSIRRIVKPINQLSEMAQDVGNGNFDVSVDIHTNDELEMLTDVFNTMVVDIRDLMHKSVEHEKELQAMQTENLMLQINPHFIYNTINSIVYMARMNDNTQIADFANAFSTLLQSTLDIRDSIYSTVGQELTVVKNYIYLQMYRYGDKFTYQVDCEEEFLDCQILNVMLQPAVENAIFHGLAPKDSRGTIRISVCRKDDILKICVADDGIGMTEETLEELKKPEYVQRGGVRKIGVSNVRERIRSIYGAPYDLVIKSELGVGTQVIMTVPYRKKAPDTTQMVKSADKKGEKQEEKE